MSDKGGGVSGGQSEQYATSGDDELPQGAEKPEFAQGDQYSQAGQAGGAPGDAGYERRDDEDPDGA